MMCKTVATRGGYGARRGESGSSPRGRWAVCVAAAFFAVWSAGCGESDVCSGVACSDLGSCYVEVDGYLVCNCDDGYYPAAPQRCLPQDPDDPCRGVLCLGYGNCRLEGDEATCDCFPGYHRSEVEPLNCVPGEFDADAGEDGEAGEGEAEAGLCGNGVIDPGEICDSESEICGDCSRGTRTCDPTSCRWGSCIGDPGQTCTRACPAGQCLNRFLSQTDPTCGCETYHHCLANCGNEGRGTGYDPWGTPCGPVDSCTMGIEPTDYEECHC